MIEKVDVMLATYSQYGVQQHFGQKIYEAFQRRGLKTRLLKGEKCWNLPLQNPPDLIFQINGCIKIDAHLYLCDLLRIPHVTYFIDPSFHFVPFLNSPYIVAACDDKSSCSFLDFLKFSPSIFLPHAVEPELVGQFQEERCFDISTLATFIDYEEEKNKWASFFSPAICGAMEEAAQVCLADETTPFVMAFIQSLSQKLKIPPENSEFFKESAILQAFKTLERYIKGSDRIDLIKAVTKSHQVHLFGNDEVAWKKYFKGNSNLIVHPAVSYEEALNVMKKSKIVLNSSIKNKHGAHERIFSALACGAIPVTNDNFYLRETFIDGQEIILFNRSQFAKMNETIHHLLLDERERKAVVHAGCKKVLAFHTWDHRIDQLLKFL